MPAKETISTGFTPAEAKSHFACMGCTRELITPGGLLSLSAISELRQVGFWCEFCYETASSQHYDATFIDLNTGETWTPKYADYLNSPQWATLRRLALKAADNRCQVCNSDLLLQVHHRKYPKVLGWEELSDLTVLCRRCHDLFHNSTR